MECLLVLVCLEGLKTPASLVTSYILVMNLFGSLAKSSNCNSKFENSGRMSGLRSQQRINCTHTSTFKILGCFSRDPCLINKSKSFLSDTECQGCAPSMKISQQVTPKAQTSDLWENSTLSIDSGASHFNGKKPPIDSGLLIALESLGVLLAKPKSVILTTLSLARLTRMFLKAKSLWIMLLV